MAEKPMTDEDIVTRLTAAAGQAVGFSETKLAKERERVRKFYEGDGPDKTSAGDSSYVSLDVFEGVEAMKAQLMEAALSTHRPVIFSPGPGESDEQASARTEWCDKVIYDLNTGFKTMGAAIDDGLRNRNGIVKVWWEVDAEEETYDLSDVSRQAVEAHLAEDPKATVEDYTEHDNGMDFKRVRLTRQIDRSRVHIECIPPEEFGISSGAESIRKAEFVFHRRQLSVSELLKMGFDKSKVMALQNDKQLWEGTDSDQYGRFQETDDMLGTDAFSDLGKARNRCLVYECYANLDVNGEGVSRLFKVTFAGSTLLEKERVDRIPFIDFCPLPRPHAFWGTNYAKLLMQTQVARTYLTRSILNHAMITNNPRLMVVRGAVLNPRELIDNRIGGLVNVTRPDGIVPIPQTGLNPFIFQTIALLDDNKEQLTGISKLSQGLNKDAISSQNSQGMVNDLINNSQTRQRVVVRNWCENFLRALYTEVYQLSLENEDQSKLALIGGQWQPVDFTSWPQDSMATVQVTLGPQAQQEELQKWIVYDKMMSADPELKQLYPMDKRFAVIKRAMVASGMKDWQNYIITPDKVPPPQPDPMHEADLEVKRADAAVKRANAQAAAESLKVKQMGAQTKHEEFTNKLALAARKEADNYGLARDKLAHEVSKDAAALKMEQDLAAKDALTGSVSLSQ